MEECKMKNLFIEYPKCSTCQKAEKWLKENKIEYEKRNIVEENPNKEDLIVKGMEAIINYEYKISTIE